MRTSSQDALMKKFGVSQEDIKTSQLLFQEMCPRPSVCACNPNRRVTKEKAEALLGYSVERLQRSKALKVLGTSEDMIEEENCKNLGSLGVAGRRRSFVIQDDSGSEGGNKYDLGKALKKSRKRTRGSFEFEKKHKGHFAMDRKNKKNDDTSDIGVSSLRTLEGTINGLQSELQCAKREISELKRRVEELERREQSAI